MKLTVAIDGPAGAGKSTIAKLVGKKFNLVYINTGAMYRAVTIIALRNGITAENISKLCNMIDNLEMHFEDDNIIVNGEDLSNEIITPEISGKVSSYAAVLEVRERLVNLQKKIAENYSVVMDGRDIGTVVLKNADFKFYLTALPEKRAERRYKELIDKGINAEYKNILSDIIKRDYADSHREIDPLTKAVDAIEIDSSTMNIKEVVDLMAEYIYRR
ncbi:(d)CMP kinase [Clostridium akagii]|uniref:(d)CMP kinase n=1 Tax=Clostridium akagii TaxID=91623 RepID=UPI00047AB812|nr:(d)CMP kinase [Clostridium akagii]